MGIFLTGTAWQESSYHSALILGLCDALASSRSQSCQNNLAGTPKARLAAYQETRTSSEMMEWWGLCACKPLGTIYSSYVICALTGFYYSAFLLAPCLWRLRWTWRGGLGKLSVTSRWAGRLGKLQVWEQVLSGSSCCFWWCLCCNSVKLGLVLLDKALLPPELWVAEVAAQHRNCVMEVLVPYLMRSVVIVD